MMTILMLLMVFSLMAISFHQIIPLRQATAFFRLIPWRTILKFMSVAIRTNSIARYAFALLGMMIAGSGTMLATVEMEEILKETKSLNEKMQKDWTGILSKVDEGEKERKKHGDLLSETKSDLEKRIKDFGATVDDVKKVVDGLKGAAKNEADEIKKRQDEFETRMKSGAFGESQKVKSIGHVVSESQEVKDFLKNRQSGGSNLIDVKSFFRKDTLTTDPASGGAGIVPFRVPGIVMPLPQQSLRIRDLLNITPISSPNLEYVRFDTFESAESGEASLTTNKGGAKIVAETAAKPESTMKFSLQTANAKTIATWLPITEQMLADAPVLRGFIDGMLVYSVLLEEETQLLYGDGTGANLEGITTLAAAYSRRIAGDNAVDTIRRSITQTLLSRFPATGVVTTPADWEGIELTKVGGTDVRYLFADPQNRANPRIWGLPVVESESIATGDFLTGAFGVGATLYDRQVASVKVGFINDQFIKNMMTLRAEERVLLAVFRPNAFVYGQLEAS